MARPRLATPGMPRHVAKYLGIERWSETLDLNAITKEVHSQFGG